MVSGKRLPGRPPPAVLLVSLTRGSSPVADGINQVFKSPYCNLLGRQKLVGATIYPLDSQQHRSIRGDRKMEDDELSATLDLILAELDTRPPTTWSLMQARRVLASLRADSSPKPVVDLVGCVAPPRLVRIRRLTRPGT